MRTLNSEPRITLNWTPCAWGVSAFTYATPSKKAAAFDLAMAMAELRSVAAERDNFAEALQRNCTEYVQKQQALIAERDKLRAAHQIAVAGWNAATIERDHARQSLRAAEADLAETEQVNADLRGVNKRLVADLAAATQRADTAEAILRAMA